MIKNLNSKHYIYLLFSLSFIIRSLLGFYEFQNENWITKFNDDILRKEFAQNILEKGFVYEITNYYSADTIFAPVVPAIISFTMLLFGSNWSWLVIFILNSIISAITCLLVFKVSNYFFNIKISYFAFLFAAFYPAYIRYIPTAGNEPWIVFLFILTFWLLLKTIESKKTIYTVIFSAIAFTFLFHTDERYISYYSLIIVFFIFTKSPVLLKLKKIIVFSFIVMMFSTPWLIRNYIVYDDFILLTVRTTNITDPFFHHREELIYNHILTRNYLTESQIDSIQKGLITCYPDGRSFERGQVEAMKSGIIPHKFSKIESFFSRLYFLWLPVKFRSNYRIDGYCYEGTWSLKHNLLTGLSYGLLLPFALFTLFILIKKNRLLPLFLFAGVLFFHTLIHIAFIPYTRDRYRHPIDFIIIILGCNGIYIIANYILNKRKNKLHGIRPF